MQQRFRCAQHLPRAASSAPENLRRPSASCVALLPLESAFSDTRILPLCFAGDAAADGDAFGESKRESASDISASPCLHFTVRQPVVFASAEDERVPSTPEGPPSAVPSPPAPSCSSSVSSLSMSNPVSGVGAVGVSRRSSVERLGGVSDSNEAVASPPNLKRSLSSSPSSTPSFPFVRKRQHSVKVIAVSDVASFRYVIELELLCCPLVFTTEFFQRHQTAQIRPGRGKGETV